MYYRLAVILVLLNLYCFASPIPSFDQNQYQQPALLENTMNKQLESSISYNNNELNYFKILCEVYGHCNDNDEQQIIDYNDIKHKRLSSSFFHGIPKFGKRAFKSAFAGIPKFG
jgi:hypothetical protein